MAKPKQQNRNVAVEYDAEDGFGMPVTVFLTGRRCQALALTVTEAQELLVKLAAAVAATHTVNPVDTVVPDVVG
jgi:hypothetical protein